MEVKIADCPLGAKCAGRAFSFAIHPLIKRRLVRGADELGLTKDYEGEIAAFESRYRQERPWLPWHGAEDAR